MSRFLLVTCQVGAEAAVKGELARGWPDFRMAYSRPGFLTFKFPEDRCLAADFDLKSVFARAYGFSLGKVSGSDPQAMAGDVWQLWGDQPVDRVHVWERDRCEPGEHGFDPGITPPAVAAYDGIRQACPPTKRLAGKNDLGEAARPGDRVLDCILVEPGEWWIGFHRARSIPSRWPGGLMPIEMPADAVSRAWLKIEEGLRWSQLPIPKAARCAEIGSSPGGASQCLIARGYEVLGIDPAEMAPAVLAQPRFRHLRRRAAEVPRREFRKVRWLMADMNVAPAFTLDAVEAIVTHAEVNIRGLLLTLKLLDWDLAASVPEYLQRVRGWGYNLVDARQLQHNRREFCLAALKKPFFRKPVGPLH
jgi:23S rRNA (cytidine2498-2'-O)-methyltransferase